VKRMPFERPTDHYDERLFEIDEQLCALLKQRKEISHNNPGFPPFESISNWARKFELYEDFLKSVFGGLRNEEHFRPIVEPTGFRKHVSILKSIEKGEYIYSVPFIWQYTNASVVNFNIDWVTTNDLEGNQHRHSFFELFLGEQYDCKMTSGSGSSGHYSYKFIVSPPLPDDILGVDLVFKEFSKPFGDKPTGLELVIHIDE
jgi:hypothetical protein